MAAGRTNTMINVTLHKKTFVPRVSPAPGGTPDNQTEAVGRTRRGGILLAIAGLLLLAVSAGDVLAGSVGWEESGDELRGSGTGKIIHGTDSADELYGGAGRDLILGGAGDDFIEAKDGLRDLVGCGAGYDVVSVDDKDVIFSGCEVVYRS